MFVLVIVYDVYGVLLALWYCFRSQWTVSYVLCSHESYVFLPNDIRAPRVRADSSSLRDSNYVVTD